MMLGAIAGDIIGSAYEWNFTKSPDFELFTPLWMNFMSVICEWIKSPNWS